VLLALVLELLLQVVLCHLTEPTQIGDRKAQPDEYVSGASGLGSVRARVFCSTSAAFASSSNLLQIFYG
jgi:hypothetical protein